MDPNFPRTTVAGISLSRMIIGTNWMAGWSHRSPAADDMIRRTHSRREHIDPILKVFLDQGIDTIMGLFSLSPVISESVQMTQQATGKRMILLDTPILNMDDNPKARAEAQAAIRKSRDLGATFCLIHHTSAEQLVNKNRQTLDRLDDYTDMIRDAGLIPGLSAHMPELVVYSDQNGYDVETYIQIYNCAGFLMQFEAELVSGIIHNARKPVMTIKPMAAGRVTPYVGLNFSWATIRDCDMVTVGCQTPEEALEDIEISRAALERRFPDIGRRDSPNTTQAAYSKTE